MRFAKRMPMVTLSWNNMLRAPRILVGAISERKTGTACYAIDISNDQTRKNKKKKFSMIMTFWFMGVKI